MATNTVSLAVAQNAQSRNPHWFQRSISGVANDISRSPLGHELDYPLATTITTEQSRIQKGKTSQQLISIVTQKQWPDTYSFTN